MSHMHHSRRAKDAAATVMAAFIKRFTNMKVLCHTLHVSCHIYE